MNCRDAIGIAVARWRAQTSGTLIVSRVYAHTSAVAQRTSLIFVTAPSGCVSNQHRQKPLRIEILDAER